MFIYIYINYLNNFLKVDIVRTIAEVEASFKSRLEKPMVAKPSILENLFSYIIVSFKIKNLSGLFRTTKLYKRLF